MMVDQQMHPAEVRCHSGYIYAQRPVSFSFAGQDHAVEKIAAEKRLPDGRQFLVVTDEGKLFDLIYSEGKDLWQVRSSDRGNSHTQGAVPKNHAE